MNLEWMPQINPTVCIGCSNCIISCPTGALAQRDHKSSLQYPERCIYCAVCEDICPVGAIELPYLIVKLGYQEEQ